MKLKKFRKLCKSLNNTEYELWVMDEHCITAFDKKYDRYKVYEIFKKRSSPDTIFISIYKDRRFKNAAIHR